MSTIEKNSSNYKKVIEEISTEFFKDQFTEVQLNQNQLNQNRVNQNQLKSSFDLVALESKIMSLAAQTPQDQFIKDQCQAAVSVWFTKITSWFRADLKVYYTLCAVMMIAVMAAWLAPSTFYDGHNQSVQVAELSVVNQPVDDLELTFQELWLVENELLFSEEI